MLGKLAAGEIAVVEVVTGEIVLEKLCWGNDLTPIRHAPLFILHGRSFEISRKIPLSM